MQVNVAVQLAEGETFGPSHETAAKGVLKACGGTLANDVCSLQVMAPQPPVVVGKAGEPVTAVDDKEAKTKK